LQPEPISPELVLVDPVLAERERARLCEKARLAELLERDRAVAPAPDVVDVAALRRAVEEASAWEEPPPDIAPRDRRSVVRNALLPAALLCSLLANGVLAAELVVRSDAGKPVLAIPAAERPAEVGSITAESVTTTPSTKRSRVAAAPRTHARALPQRSIVEQKLVSLILTAPAQKLPRLFVDPATGLIRNNVRVTCRRAASRVYRCAIQLPADARHALVVRYRVARSGASSFTWYGYRRVSVTGRFLQDRRTVRREKIK
jgi:hypothetical protein